MIIQKTSGRAERRVLIGMITRKRVLASVSSRWGEGGLFQSKWSNVVGQLCVEHFREYAKAPKRSMEAMFEAWAATRKRDQETVDLVEKFLASISAEHENATEQNDAHLIDQAGTYFNEVRLRKLARGVDGFLEAGRIDEADALVTASRRLNLGVGASIDVLQDRDAVIRAFEEKEEPLLTLPDGLGKFFTHSLKREAFISFLAPEKVGKTTHLVEMAWRAMLSRLKVAFFSIGDESENEMILRFAQRASRRPLYPETLRIPTSLEINKGGEPDKRVVLKHKVQVFEQGLDAAIALKAFERVQTDKIKSVRPFLRMSVHAAGSLSVEEMEQQLDEWAYADDWVADIAVIDYMENLKESGNPRDDIRHRISATWRDVRAVAQRRRLLVLTATQANAAGAGSEFLTREHFSESKTKLAHVTGMVGINQTLQEKVLGLQRLNWVVRRGAYYNESRSCYCAGVWGAQSPVVLSYF